MGLFGGGENVLDCGDGCIEQLLWNCQLNMEFLKLGSSLRKKLYTF